MFLIGGPAFSGTTLLTLLLNQGTIVCLDEPDVHDPEQSHRGIPVLESRFPDSSFPTRPSGQLTYEEATALLEQCEQAIAPYELGMKTCDWPFVGYAEVYRGLGFPVIAIVRDIRDALVRPLPDWLDEAGLNVRYRLIWERSSLADLVIRYDDLVADTESVMARVTRALRRPLSPAIGRSWVDVPGELLKLDRHELLREGKISPSRVGIWRTSGRSFSDESQETAAMMGYPPPL
jgi:hypothetical protein